MEEKIKVLSLFSSGGVAEAHLEDLGIEILIANEIRKDRYVFYINGYRSRETANKLVSFSINSLVLD